ncbi:MAG: adenosylcobinamide-GDP ribazoletransferase, partial [Pseudomonadota bacterium]
DRPVDGEEIGRCTGWFPVVGLAIGIGAAVLAWLLSAVVGAGIVAAMVVGYLTVVTRAFHLDGLADIFDGIVGSRGDRERALRIMKDSSIGAFGATALVVVLGAKLAAVAEIVRQERYWAAALAPASARWAVVPLIFFFPYLRQLGLGSSFKRHGQHWHLLAATGAVCSLLVVGGTRSLFPALCSLGAALALGWWVQKRLGGLTGDAYGAAIELAETAFLVASVATH